MALVTSAATSAGISATIAKPPPKASWPVRITSDTTTDPSSTGSASERPTTGRTSSATTRTATAAERVSLDRAGMTNEDTALATSSDTIAPAT